ncbi:MAG: TIGR01777 family oxidoreductase [Flavobacteriales bacterium]
MSKKVLITGGSGFVGSHLTPAFQGMGYEVVHLSHRTPIGNEPVKTFHWDVHSKELDKGAFEGVDAVIHLAGAGVMDHRWTQEYKKVIEESRVRGTELLVESMRKLEEAPKTFISASAIGYYGSMTTDKPFKENDPPGDDFLAQVTRKWEEAADQAADMARVVKLRTGLVLDRDEGPLPQMARPIRFGVGAPLGSGNQYMPWIHILDICRAYIFALHKENMEGAYNVVAPEHVTNQEVTSSIAKVLNRPVFLPGVPEGIMKLALGERGSIALEGSPVSSEKLQQEGFDFKYPTLMGALEAIYQPLQKDEEEGTP